MRKHPVKWTAVVLVLLASIGLLWPSVSAWLDSRKVAEMAPDARATYLAGRPATAEGVGKPLKLGLDLQGGMHVVMEVNTIQMLEKLARNPDDDFTTRFEQFRKDAAESDDPMADFRRVMLADGKMRLSRYYGDRASASNDEIISDLTTQTTDAVSRAINIIRNRIDQFGVAEPSIVRQGARRIAVELPGVSDRDRVRKLLGATASLEFRLLADPVATNQTIEDLNRYLAAQAGVAGDATFSSAADSTATDSTRSDSTRTDSTAVAAAPTAPKDTTRANRIKQNPLLSVLQPYGRSSFIAKHSDRDQINRYLRQSDVRNRIPASVTFAWSSRTETGQSGEELNVLYALRGGEPELGGKVVESARESFDEFNQPSVSMSMNSEGASRWSEVTGANVNKQIAVVLDSVVFSAPVVRSQITGGNSSIDGMSNINEARDLVNVLKAGALPAPVNVLEERTVGASLGADSVRSGLWSFLLALVVVALFMVMYYRGAGWVANLTLLFNLIIVMAVMAGLGATLTLPGIAGVILTIGMAVDANVLIYERIREEQAVGRTRRAAVEAGFARAASAIWDGNLTTLLTAMVLANFGVGPIKGFAVTLMIGILTTLFCSLVVTRLLLENLVETPEAEGEGRGVSFG